MTALDNDPSSHERRRHLLALSGDEWLSLVLLSGFVAALFWPQWELVPGSGLDPSWRTGLSWAFQNGLHWGPDVVFTYGPLAVLRFPLAAHWWQPAVASMVWLVEVVVLLTLLYLLVRLRGLPRLQTLAIPLGVSAVFLAPVAPHILVTLVLVASALAVVTRSSVPIAVSAVALGILGQHKLSDAILALGVAAMCAVGARAWRGLALLAAVATATWVAAWVIAGQPLTDLPLHVGRALEIVRGYPTAMGSEQSGFAWHYVAAFVLIPLVCAQAWIATRGCATRVRFSVLVAVLFGLWFAGHEGFIRHDGHAWYFFGTVVTLCVVLLLSQPPGRQFRPGLVAAAAAFLVVCTIFTPFLGVIDRQASLRSLALTLEVISSKDRANQITAGRNAELVAQYKITPELLAALGSRETAVDPWDISALAPTAAVWEPLPIFQTYQAYTPALDQINADALLSSPRQLLRSSPYPAIDGRNPYWESPRYQRIAYCRYDVDFETPGWQVLTPSPADRCGDTPTPAGSSDARAGEAIAVPRRDGAITLVTVTPAKSALTQAIDLLLKPWSVYVTYGPTRWRLAQNPSAVELMLNGPLAHRAFPNLAAMPLATISVSTDARIDFEFLDVTTGSAEN